MSDPLRVAVAQMSSFGEVAPNLRRMNQWIAEAADDGCKLIAFPENAPLLASERVKLQQAEPLNGPQISALREMALKERIAVLVGSFTEKSIIKGKNFNTSVLLDPDGEIVAIYRKMHLFDVNIAEDTSFLESKFVLAGPAIPVVADLFGWRIGLSICYDLRFPELYRALSKAGAELLCVPAAFTFRTGSAHWHTLLKARAIENLAYVIAPAQAGRHYGKRESYGHALIVSPWGEIIAEQALETGWIAGELHKDHLVKCRQNLPSLTHRRI